MPRYLRTALFQLLWGDGCQLCSATAPRPSYRICFGLVLEKTPRTFEACAKKKILGKYGSLLQHDEIYPSANFMQSRLMGVQKRRAVVSALFLQSGESRMKINALIICLFFVSACRLLRGLALLSPPPLRLVESRELGTSAGSDHAATAGGGVTFRSIVNHCIDIIVSSSWCTHNANDIVWY